MPWHVSVSASCPASKPYAVIKDADGSVAGCHPSKKAAQRQLAALYANEPRMEGSSMSTEEIQRRTDAEVEYTPPREKQEYRRYDLDDMFELHRSETEEMPVLAGYFSVFNEWAEIRSKQEGHFMERVAPGAFKRTIGTGFRSMRVCLDHGTDPFVGNKPLGPIQVLEERDRGAYYEVPLLNTSYNRDLVPALEQGLYGSSFRFSVMRDDFNPKPRASETNPDALPERTILEAKVREFGPVSFAAYSGATAGIRCRSITDHVTQRFFAAEAEYLQDLVHSLPEEATTAPSTSARTNTAPEVGARDQASDPYAAPAKTNWWAPPNPQRRIPKSWDG